ncbi:MAG: hypothetical protein MUC93_02905 [Bacteroidales bacterium]|jgi:hypothetical protein|nr:hypothetical protein [Bacteroidales bacterium]
MKTIIKITFLAISLCPALNAHLEKTRLTGSYLGQNPPGLTPEVFAPEIISTDAHEFSCCFSPDGNEIYFTRMNPEERQNYIMFTRLTDGSWTEPVELKPKK